MFFAYNCAFVCHTLQKDDILISFGVTDRCPSSSCVGVEPMFGRSMFSVAGRGVVMEVVSIEATFEVITFLQEVK